MKTRQNDQSTKSEKFQNSSSRDAKNGDQELLVAPITNNRSDFALQRKWQDQANNSTRIQQLANMQQLANEQTTSQFQLGPKAKIGDRVEIKESTKIWRIKSVEGYGGGKTYLVENEANTAETEVVKASDKKWFRLNLVRRKMPEDKWIETIAKLNSEKPKPLSSINVSTKGGQAWDYTLTYQFNIHFSEVRTEIVRAHVHYTRKSKWGSEYKKAGGNMWISGLDYHDDRTAGWIVKNAPDVLPSLGKRGEGW